jgi:hypothetical protein
MTAVNLPIEIARQFSTDRIDKIESFGSGNINDTFLVTVDRSTEPHFVLQRINTKVFRQPELVMQNMRILSDWVSEKPDPILGRRWQIPHTIQTRKERDYYLNPEDDTCWRAITYIEGSHSVDTIDSIGLAGEVGYALGTFHNSISDLPAHRLADTLPGFHITPVYLQQYLDLLEMNGDKIKASPYINYCLKFIERHQNFAHILEDAKRQGKLVDRAMHGDPKVNNVLLCTDSNRAIGMVDLDTVKPGLVHYDIGDGWRSGCNLAGEETEDWQGVEFETDLAQAMMAGYLDRASQFLTEQDYLYIFESIFLLAFELGLRFFTDHLSGNVYFKVNRPEHNLARALVQFKLAESIERQKSSILAIVSDFR